MTMQDKIKLLKDRWQQLSLREQKALRFSGLLIVIFMIYQFMWSPFLQQVAMMRERIKSDEKILAFMQQTDRAIKEEESKITPNNRLSSPALLLSFLQKQIVQAGLQHNLGQLKQASHDTIEMHFQSVEFDKLMQLLLLVIKEQHLMITQMSAVTEGTPGIVNVDII